MAQKLEECRDIKSVPDRGVGREILFRELKKSHRRLQTPAVFRMRRMFEILLEMNKRACRLNKALEKVGVGRICFQPQLLQNIVRFVIALFIPALKKCAIK